MMTWYFESIGGHTHVRVFFEGHDAGELCFRNVQFNRIKGYLENTVFTQVTDIHGKRKPV